MGEQIIVKSYVGREAEATKKFQADSLLMAAQGYSPVFQSWTPGQWQTRSLIAALLLCLLIVGIPALLYMLIATPDGALTVTYAGSRADPAPEGLLGSKPSNADSPAAAPQSFGKKLNSKLQHDVVLGFIRDLRRKVRIRLPELASMLQLMSA